MKLSVMRHLQIVALVCATSFWAASARNPISCLDENGRPVDWYIGYKFPKLLGLPKFDTGLAHAYFTSDSIVEPANDDIQLDRKLDNESYIFLRQFKDLLVKFGGLFVNQSKGARNTRAKKSSSSSRRTPEDARWSLSSKLLGDPQSLLIRTLAVAYDPNLLNEISSIFYNDDPEKTEAASDDPEFESESGSGVWTKKNIPSRVAHAKGVLLMDEETNSGIWLTHSVPKFPNVREHILEYPETAIKFGQTFMCVTFDLKKTGGQLIDHLANMRPLVYDRHVTDSLAREFPKLQDLDLYANIRFKRQKNPDKLAQTIVTKAGQVLKLYSKPPSVQEDLYGGWIDHDLSADLYVESWRRGSGGVLPSSCPRNDYHVNNIKDLKYSPTVQWDYIVDHSKWAITHDEEVATLCIGDSNRMESQFKRGSGAVCIKCPSCWSIFSNTVQDTEPCPISSNKGMKRASVIDYSLPSRVKRYLTSAY